MKNQEELSVKDGLALMPVKDGPLWQLENLRACLASRELRNVVDFAAGYKK